MFSSFSVVCNIFVVLFQLALILPFFQSCLYSFSTFVQSEPINTYLPIFPSSYSILNICNPLAVLSVFHGMFQITNCSLTNLNLIFNYFVTLFMSVFVFLPKLLHPISSLFQIISYLLPLDCSMLFDPFELLSCTSTLWILFSRFSVSSRAFVFFIFFLILF